MRRHLAAPPALALALSAGCTCASEPSDAPEPATEVRGPSKVTLDHPDIVLVTLDTTRADHLGAYGYFRDTSPVFDALAAQSVLFERLLVPMATTLPTHTSILTGTWPTEHGVVANIQHGGRRFQPSDALVPFTMWAADLGYRTAAFVSAAPLNKDSGIARGFEVFDDPPRIERPGNVTTDAALAWLAQAPEEPMFLWVHYYDPHNPFAPPDGYAERFAALNDDDVMDAWLDARQVSKVTKRPTGQVVRIRPATQAYDGEIRFMDEQLGRLLEGLQARGRRDNTLLIVLGDHGEGMNQHEQPGHGLTWNEQLHAPWLIQAPGVAPARIPHIASAADVLPTALGMVDLPEEERFLEQVSGADVMAPGFVERAVLSQTSERQLMFDKPMTYVLTGPQGKCRWAEGEPSLFWDLTQDPFELAPVGTGPDLDACVAELQNTLAVQRLRATQLGSGKTTEMTPEDIEALRALGYLDGDAE